MEKDPEWNGEGNSYTTEFRQYDPRVGRWLSLDPLMAQFPDVSAYVAFANNPIYFIDPFGLAPIGDEEANHKYKKKNQAKREKNDSFAVGQGVADAIQDGAGDGDLGALIGYNNALNLGELLIDPRASAQMLNSNLVHNSIGEAWDLGQYGTTREKSTWVTARILALVDAYVGLRLGSGSFSSKSKPTDLTKLGMEGNVVYADDIGTITPIEGYVDVVAHGDDVGNLYQTTAVDADGAAIEFRPLDPFEIAEDLRSRGLADKPIRLCACDGAKLELGNATAAKKLAQATGQRVLAPTKTLWVDTKTGAHWITDAPTPEEVLLQGSTGFWRAVLP